MMYPDGSMDYWPEWPQTVPQNQWTPEQIAFMQRHQERWLAAMKAQSEKYFGRAAETQEVKHE